MTRPTLASVLFAGALALCAGCEVQKVEDEAARSKQAKPEPEPETEPAPAAHEPKRGARGSGLGAVFRGTKPQLPALIAELHSGQSLVEVRALAPELSDTERPKFKHLDDPRSELGWDLRFDEVGDEGRLLAVTTELERRAALGHAKRSWGEPRTVTDAHGTSYFWFDEQAKLRASLSPVNTEGALRLEFMPYLSVTELLAPASTALSSGAMLGLGRAEVEAKYAEQLRRVVDRPGTWTAQLWYPASTWNPQPTLVSLVADEAGEGVESVMLELPFLFLPKLRAELFAELVELFGEPLSGDADAGGRFTTEAVDIEVRSERGRWILTTTAR